MEWFCEPVWRVKLLGLMLSKKLPLFISPCLLSFMSNFLPFILNVVIIEMLKFFFLKIILRATCTTECSQYSLKV